MARNNGIDIQLNDDGLRWLEQNGASLKNTVVGKVAFDAVADAQTSFTAGSPSAPGQPPAVVTGAYRASIRARKLDEGVYEIRAAGLKYPLALEFGTVRMRPRPLFKPVLRRAKARLREAFRQTIEGMGQ